MNPSDRSRVGEQWMALGLLYDGREIPRPALKLMLDAISDLEADRVLQAFREWVNDKKSTRYPTPGQLRALVRPSPDPRSMAIATSLRVREAISKFGWCNARSAREYVGESGWKFVERFGGWLHLCENLGVNLNENTFLAQARDAIESDISLNKIGFDTDQPLLEQQNKPIGKLIKNLSDRLELDSRLENKKLIAKAGDKK